MKGHIRKRGARYYPTLELSPEQDPETGERIRQRIPLGGFARKGEAQEALDDAKEAARRGWRGPSRVTLADYLRREWLPGVDMQLAKTTAALYRTLAEAYVIPRLGGRRLDALSSADLTGLSPTSSRPALAVVARCPRGRFATSTPRSARRWETQSGLA